MLAAPVVTFIGRVVYFRKTRPFETFVAHPDVPTVIAFIAPLLLLALAFGWKTVTTVYGDHQDLAERNAMLIIDNSMLRDEEKTAEVEVEQQRQEIA